MSTTQNSYIFWIKSNHLWASSSQKQFQIFNSPPQTSILPLPHLFNLRQKISFSASQGNILLESLNSCHSYCKIHLIKLLASTTFISFPKEISPEETDKSQYFALFYISLTLPYFYQLFPFLYHWFLLFYELLPLSMFLKVLFWLCSHTQIFPF